MSVATPAHILHRVLNINAHTSLTSSADIRISSSQLTHAGELSKSPRKRRQNEADIRRLTYLSLSSLIQFQKLAAFYSTRINAHLQ